MFMHLPGPALGLSALLLLSTPALAESTLRLTQLQRCGDLLAERELTFCLRSEGTAGLPYSLHLAGQAIDEQHIEHNDSGLRLRLDAAHWRSGPLWLEQDGQRSNPVWLSLGRSHVVAASEERIARNSDGLPSYIDLVSLVIEEDQEGLPTARRLAERYGAQVVGAIPPLNTYQLRLPVKDLTERDALVLRLDNEPGVDAVVIEETGAQAHEAERAAHQEREQERAANRFLDAVAYYRHRIASREAPIATTPVRIGVIERDLDFDAPVFRHFLAPCEPAQQRTCLYGRDAERPDSHGSSVAGLLAAHGEDSRDLGFLSALDGTGPGFEVIVERNSDAGITANIAASVNLVEDGARILNWSWGIHRVGTLDADGEPVDSLLRSGVAMSGYEELLEEFFRWLRREHPDVLVINSAGNGSARSGRDDYRLPSSFITEQLLVVGGHQRTRGRNLPVEHPGHVTRRPSSNLDMRVDITAAACVRAATRERGMHGEVHCGTSYATPLVAGTVAAMLSINPQLQPEQVRELLRRSAMTVGGESDFEPADADDLTAPILPSEREQRLDDADIGRSARLDMHRALELTVSSLRQVR